jgi:hypothetical protein
LRIAIQSVLASIAAPASSGDVEFPESTIGTEFMSGELSGLLESDAPNAKVTALWAGTSCIFR